MGNGVSTLNKPFSTFKDALNDLLSNAHLQILLIGIESSGKSTLLQRLKYNHYVEMTPTVGFDSCKLKYQIKSNRIINIQLWDLGGQDRVRPLWRSFIKCADAICFVVDASDISKLDEAKMEFNSALSHFYEFKRNLNPNNFNKHNVKTSTKLYNHTAKTNDNIPPLIVLANKCDLPTNPFANEKGIHMLNDYFFNNVSFQKIEEFINSHASTKIKETIFLKPLYNVTSIIQENGKGLYNKQKSLDKPTNNKIPCFFSSTTLNMTPRVTRTRILDDHCLKDNQNLSKNYAKIFSSTSNLNSTIQSPAQINYSKLSAFNKSAKPNSQAIKQSKDADTYKQLVFPVCGVTGEGLDEALEILIEIVDSYKRRKHKRI